jgi:hypothetical protein
MRDRDTLPEIEALGNHVWYGRRMHALLYDVHDMFAADVAASARVDSRAPAVESVLMPVDSGGDPENPTRGSHCLQHRWLVPTCRPVLAPRAGGR